MPTPTPMPLLTAAPVPVSAASLSRDRLIEGEGLAVGATIEPCLHEHAGRASARIDDPVRRVAHLPGVGARRISDAFPVVELRVTRGAGEADDDIDGHVGLARLHDDV